MDELGVIIGIDESGTGAWAGPFSVCAVALPAGLKIPGVTDSKAMSDGRRRNSIESIADHALHVSCTAVDVDAMNRLGLAGAWWRGVRLVAGEIVEHLLTLGISESKIRVVVDGNPPKLRGGGNGSVELGHALGIAPRHIRWVPKADRNYSAVSAASVVAKTKRNDEMLRLAKEWPEYQWHKNYGYGTREHVSALETHGKTPQHRNYKPLANYPRRIDVVTEGPS